MERSEDTIAKLQYHVELLRDALPDEGTRMVRLIVSSNWDADDVDAAEEIFDRYQYRCEQGIEINNSAIEDDFRKRFGMGYQRFKEVIRAFYEQRRFLDVCIQFAKLHKVSEFSEILSENKDYQPPKKRS